MTQPIPRRALAAAAGRPRRWLRPTTPTAPCASSCPAPPAAPADVLGRLVMERLSQKFGQPFTVENRAGAGTNIGMTVVARAAPDGYVLGLASIAANAVNRWLYRNMPFNPETDFSPIAMIALVPNLMVVSALGAGDQRGRVHRLCASSNPVAYGSVGAGSSQHLAGGAVSARRRGWTWCTSPTRPTARWRRISSRTGCRWCSSRSPRWRSWPAPAACGRWR